MNKILRDTLPMIGTADLAIITTDNAEGGAWLRVSLVHQTSANWAIMLRPTFSLQ